MTTAVVQRYVPLETEPTIPALIELLSLTEDELLATTKAHMTAQLIPALLPSDFLDNPFQYMAKGFSLLSFLRERAARPAGRKLAVLLRAGLSDGGRNICDRINYCDNREAWKTNVEKAKAAILGAFGFSELRDEFGQIKATVAKALPDWLSEYLAELLQDVTAVGQLIAENIDIAIDVSVPIATPISLTLYMLLYSLDDICQCDLPPVKRRWPTPRSDA